MDSFIGAIDILENGKRPLLVGHTKSSAVKPYQEHCYNALQKHYQANVPIRIHAFVRIPEKKPFGIDDHTERGRSFLFLRLGNICASTLQSKSKLIVPENGMISLNIPLAPLRVGSHSNPTKSFIFIFQSTKDGNFRGANSFQHDVDVVIEVPEQGKAIQMGRFNQGGEIQIFE